MRSIGAIVVVLGLMVLLVGIGIDTTETATTCYETDYSWGVADSSGCVETTYSNPFPKFAAITSGIVLIVAGGVLSSQKSRLISTSPKQSSTSENSDLVAGENTEGSSFAEKLQQRQTQKESEEDS